MLEEATEDLVLKNGILTLPYRAFEIVTLRILMDTPSVPFAV